MKQTSLYLLVYFIAAAKLTFEPTSKFIMYLTILTLVLPGLFL